MSTKACSQLTRRASSRAGAAPAPGDNVLSNGDFATGGEPWTATNDGLDVDEAADREGAAA